LDTEKKCPAWAGQAENPPKPFRAFGWLDEVSIHPYRRVVAIQTLIREFLSASPLIAMLALPRSNHCAKRRQAFEVEVRLKRGKRAYLGRFRHRNLASWRRRTSQKHSVGALAIGIRIRIFRQQSYKKADRCVNLVQSVKLQSLFRKLQFDRCAQPSKYLWTYCQSTNRSLRPSWPSAPESIGWKPERR
jgi:hypothetical protein